jgi:hypothetical protein
MTVFISQNIADPALEPKPSQNPLPTYTKAGPGYVEIKPHNVGGIRAGLRQLYKMRARKDTGYLLTYTYNTSRARDKSTVTAWLLKPTTQAVQVNGQLPENRADPITKEQQQAWLDGLGPWWSLGTHTVWELPFGVWRRFAGPPAVGSMLEHQLRDIFVNAHKVPDPNNAVNPRLSTKGHLTRDKLASAPGADIEFLELAEFLYELDVALVRAA